LTHLTVPGSERKRWTVSEGEHRQSIEGGYREEEEVDELSLRVEEEGGPGGEDLRRGLEVTGCGGVAEEEELEVGV
jgi:hypothetical protein